ncbi:MucR family transcriptional regulator [Methylobacterium fujisawaense]
MTSATNPGVPAPTRPVSTLSPSTHVTMTAGIATSYLGNNPIAPERVKDVIRSIHEALLEVHDSTAGRTVGNGMRELVESTIAGSGAIPQISTPVQEPVSEIREPTASEPAPEARPEATPEAATDAAKPAGRGRKARGIPSVSVPEPLADGGRLRRRPRLEAVAGDKAAKPEAAEAEVAETVEPAKTARGTRKAAAAASQAPAATATKQPELEFERQAESQTERKPWAVTELGLEPTYAPRSKSEIARIRKAVFVPEYDGKTGGFVRCLEDGQIRRMLKKHLKFLEIPPAEYLAKWGLPADFPLVHPEFSASRANQIKTAGLWEQRRAVRAKRGEAVDFEAPNVKEIQRREREARKAAKAA